MKLSAKFAVAALLAGSMIVYAADAPKPLHSMKVRLVKPWSDLTTLTEDQKIKISELHRKSVEDQKAIEAKEQSDIMDMLTEDQKAELQKLLDKKAAEKKKPEAVKGVTTKPTTVPTTG